MGPTRKFLLIVALILTTLACNTVNDFIAGFQTPVPIPNFGDEEEEGTAAPTRTPAQPTPTFVAPDNPNPGADGIGDPYFEDLGNGGYDVQHYELILSVNVEENEINAVANVSLVTTQPLTSLNLELAGLIVDSVSVEGMAALFNRDGSELIVYLPDDVAANQQVDISIAYHGTPGGENAYGEDFSEGWISYGDGIMVAGEPIGASTWYPVNEHPLDKATYSYTITAESNYEVAANGYLQSVEDNGDGTSTHYWLMEQPIAPYLTTVAIAEFDVQEYNGPTGLPIRNYFGEGVAQSVRDDFALQGEMIAHFESVFGPYPFQAYGVVVHDLDLYFALETATLPVFGEGFTDEYVVAHELAHMWFGDSVGLTYWGDIWLNEGFATYASELWNEHAYGRDVMDENITYTYEQLASNAAFIDWVPVADPGADYMFYSPIVYSKGMLVLHALRLEIGDDAFFDTLRAYTDRFGGGNATTPDFIAIAEEMSGEDLDAFFEEWLYGANLPDIPQMDLFFEDYE